MKTTKSEYLQIIQPQLPIYTTRNSLIPVLASNRIETLDTFTQFRLRLHRFTTSNVSPADKTKQLKKTTDEANLAPISTRLRPTVAAPPSPMSTNELLETLKTYLNPQVETLKQRLDDNVTSTNQCFARMEESFNIMQQDMVNQQELETRLNTVMDRNVADPKFKDASESERIAILKTFQENHISKTLDFLRDPVKSAIAREFHRKDLISDQYLHDLTARHRPQEAQPRSANKDFGIFNASPPYHEDSPMLDDDVDENMNNNSLNPTKLTLNGWIMLS